MKKNTPALIVTLFSTAIIFSFYFDSEIVRYVSEIRHGFLDEFFLGITFLSSKVIIFFVLTSLLFFVSKGDKRRWIVPLWLTLLLSGLVSFILKFSIQRPRPFQAGIVSVMPLLEKASYFIWNFSFPSSHAMIAFCAVPILSREFPKFKYFWILFAVLVSFSRIYLGLHYLSDVIAGGLIGYLIGAIIVKVEEEKKFGERIYKKIFVKS